MCCSSENLGGAVTLHHVQLSSEAFYQTLHLYITEVITFAYILTVL